MLYVLTSWKVWVLFGLSQFRVREGLLGSRTDLNFCTFPGARATTRKSQTTETENPFLGNHQLTRACSGSVSTAVCFGKFDFRVTEYLVPFWWRSYTRNSLYRVGRLYMYVGIVWTRNIRMIIQKKSLQVSIFYLYPLLRQIIIFHPCNNFMIHSSCIILPSNHLMSRGGPNPNHWSNTAVSYPHAVTKLNLGHEIHVYYLSAHNGNVNDPHP